MRIGAYEVVEELARGGQGVVYRARDAEGRDVAVKLLLAHKAQNPRARARFQREVETLARLQHPNVVQILAAGEHEGSPWLALEFVVGESLQARLRGGPLPVHEATRLVQQLARALSYVHACGALHRDLKPDNVLIRGDQALLTDFGLVLDEQSSQSRLTATGAFLGTPGYWAPEQARGDLAALGPGTDVYGLGGVLYACLTGHPPVSASSIGEYLGLLGSLTIEPPRRVRAEVPTWLSELCMRCLAAEPSERPTSADELARLLTLGADGQLRRRPIPWLLVAGVVALVLAGVAVAVVSSALRDDALPLAPVSSEVRDPAVEAEEHFKAGNAKGREERYVESIADYDRALALDPTHVGALRNRGLSQTWLKRFPEALADFARALELKPDDPLTLGSRAVAYGLLGRHEDALADLRRRAELEPTRASVLASIGATLGKLGRYAEAEGAYTRAIELDPTRAQAYASRGSVLHNLGRYAEAVADFDRALSLEGLSENVRRGVETLRADAMRR